MARKWKMWAGFCDDELYVGPCQSDAYPTARMARLFKTLHEARYQFRDVRPVEVRELPKARKR